MRVFHLLFIAVLFSLNAPAQKVAVGLPAMNVVYIGLDNEVRIAVEGEKSENIIKELSDGEIIEKEGKIYIRVTKRGEIKLRIGVKKRKKIKWVDSMVLRARDIPVAYPSLMTLYDGDVQSIGAIKANASRIFMPLGQGFAVEGLRGYVQSFRITVVDSTGYGTVQVKGHHLNSNALKLINNLTGGAVIYIDDIYYCILKNKDTVVPIKLSEYTLTIKARVPNTLSLVATEEERAAYIPPRPAYTITGSFYGTKKQMQYTYGFSDIGAFSHLTGLLKHGEWKYYSGLINPRTYREEYYDSSRLLKYTLYDSSGFKTIDLTISADADSVYYKELYPNGKTMREGWVVVNNSNYNFGGENTGDQISGNEYVKYYYRLKFVPVGRWKEYYESGQVKLEASFKAVENYKFTTTYTLETITYEGFTVFVSGKWTVYNEDGSIKETFNYD
ncbi:MAG TPA: hypothetical protein VEC12_09600 [Bacteroidia bacterium]|nr:hypothetical protein [Bacteroidia bacterium]